MLTFLTSTYGWTERVGTLRLCYTAPKVNIFLIHDTSFDYFSQAAEWPLNRDILGHAMTSLNKVTLLPERSKPELNIGGRGGRARQSHFLPPFQRGDKWLSNRSGGAILPFFPPFQTNPFDGAPLSAPAVLSPLLHCS